MPDLRACASYQQTMEIQCACGDATYDKMGVGPLSNDADF